MQIDYDINKNPEFFCSVCMNIYNDSNRQPLLLPKCGHTFCSDCLFSRVEDCKTNEKLFLCPDSSCDTEIDVVNAAPRFPKNLALLNILGKSTMNKQSPKRPPSNLNTDENLPPFISPTPKQLCSAHNQTKDGKQLKNEKKYESESKRVKYAIEIPTENKCLSFSNNKEKASAKQGSPVADSRSRKEVMCGEHYKAMEIFCRDEGVRICSSCALFGSHKNHNVGTEEELICEITGRAEKLLEMLVNIEKRSAEKSAQQDALRSCLGKKKEEFKALLNGKIEEIERILKLKQQEIDQKIDSFFAEADKYIESGIRAEDVRELNKKSESWKNKAQQALGALNQKEDEIVETFFKNCKGNYLEFDGANIVDEFNSLISTQSKIGSKIDYLALTFDFGDSMKSFNSHFHSTAERLEQLKANFFSLHSLLESSFKQKNAGASEVLVSEEVKVEKTPNMDSPFQGEDKNSEKKFFKVFGNNAKTKKMNILDQFMKENTVPDEENDLLEFTNLGFSDFIENLDESKASNSENRTKTEASNTGGKPNAFPKANTTVLNERRNKNEESVTKSNSRGISSNNERKSQMSQARSPFSHEKPPSSHRVSNKILGMDRSMVLNETSKSRLMVSPSRVILPNENIEATKINALKQKSKIGEKFQWVLDSIRNETTDTVDLTCAEIGDQGIPLLGEALVGNKSIKSLKLVKNKLSDDGVALLFKQLENNLNIHTINLTLNNLTERTFENWENLMKANSTIKNIYFNHNNISLNKVKTKIREFRAKGVNIYL